MWRQRWAGAWSLSTLLLVLLLLLVLMAVAAALVPQQALDAATGRLRVWCCWATGLTSSVEVTAGTAPSELRRELRWSASARVMLLLRARGFLHVRQSVAHTCLCSTTPTHSIVFASWGLVCLCAPDCRYREAGWQGVADELALDVKRLWLRWACRVAAVGAHCTLGIAVLFPCSSEQLPNNVGRRLAACIKYHHALQPAPLLPILPQEPWS